MSPLHGRLARHGTSGPGAPGRKGHRTLEGDDVTTRAWQEAAIAAMPDGVADFFAGGAGREVTVADNELAWARVRLRPRVLRDVSSVETHTTVLGTPVGLPVLVAPVAYQRLLHEDGEAATAAGAARAGSLMVVPTRSSVPIEEVASATGGPWWLQTYVLRDRSLTVDLVQRAASCGCRALVLTGDTPYVATKPRDRANGFAPPSGMVAGNARDGAEQDPSIDLQTIGWLAAIAGLPVVVKGVLRADDALECLDAGAAGIVVSNHGGRQLDGAVASADALAEVVDAVAGHAEVYVDGGLRSGTDVLKALALGARAVLVGRPVAGALAAGGAAGVERLVAELGDELREAMALTGAVSLGSLTPDLVAKAPQ
ncbi:MAG: FMN-dependent alpha-hydroxy acid dehydrogenase [Acidimicrobiaceae bacterium]|nr:FMN-dependent alpha-hydroxy acid dehydrogenase [Acidimicrobiaceae bacterium]